MLVFGIEQPLLAVQFLAQLDQLRQTLFFFAFPLAVVVWRIIVQADMLTGFDEKCLSIVISFIVT